MLADLFGVRRIVAVLGGECSVLFPQVVRRAQLMKCGRHYATVRLGDELLRQGKVVMATS